MELRCSLLTLEGYTSKYSGGEIDALMDKIKTMVTPQDG